MERYTSTVNTGAKSGCTRLASLSRPPALATATTPAMGRPMALTESPAKASHRFAPACAPRCGGKIRLPAPKNMENNVNPTNNRFLPESFCCMCTPRFCSAARGTAVDTFQCIVLRLSCQGKKT